MTTTAPPRVNPWALSGFWFGTSFHWLLLFAVLIPADMLRFVGEADKGKSQGLLIALGAAIAMLLPPIVGAYSDRVGRRLSLIQWSVVVNVVGLLIMAFAPNVWVYGLGFLVLQIGNNAATAPYSALIPQVVPPEQRGRYSGVMGLLQLSGQLLGGVVGALVGFQLLPREVTFILIAALLLFTSTLTVRFVPEPPARPAGPAAPRVNWLALFRHGPFFWVFVTRALFGLGQYSVQPLLQYYLRDVIGNFRLGGVDLGNAVTANSVMLLAIVAGGIASTLLAGRVSDRVGRKPVIYVAGTLMAVAAVALLFAPNLPVVLALAVVFGLGFGAFTSVDWALGSDAMPSAASYARDMGVWHVAFTAPQFISAPQGLLLDWGNAHGHNLGYTLVFGVAASFFVLAMLLVTRVRGVK
ncbi:MFS transporter [Deinococcus maricopensis]|uniref:Major facilitator superfamily MFS_1 n=1 Tax=Deinococcus maricopensis (strain DSM 21211 / LMG 22137 / NRRL B-23946 / LB-34) TaxID=709986 RepID=E8U788_DEIML|nr:MFS transporter [Deinococcus maricopensis]ADV66927.1 major facilitator superfamily MFS_1 [Deinococcus maricopensis DSM 21211]